MFRESGDDTEVMAKLRKKFRMCPTVMSGKKKKACIALFNVQSEMRRKLRGLMKNQLFSRGRSSIG